MARGATRSRPFLYKNISQPSGHVGWCCGAAGCDDKTARHGDKEVAAAGRYDALQDGHSQDVFMVPTGDRALKVAVQHHAGALRRRPFFAGGLVNKPQEEPHCMFHGRHVDFVHQS